MPARSCRAAFEAFEAWQTAGLNALNNIGQWPECLLEAATQRFRHLRPGERQAWTPLTTEGSGLSACSKLPRAFEAFEAWQTAGLNALNNRGQWPECLLEAAAQRLRHLRPGKRQAWTPLATEGSGGSACPKLPRSVLGGKRQAWTPLTTEGSGLSACSKQAWTPLTTEGGGLSAWRKAR